VTATVDTTGLPAALAEIAEDFADLPVAERLQLLLEFSEELPELPERYAGAPEKMEQVHECQSPLFLTVEVDEESATEPGKRVVSLYFSAPAEAPTTRGFAGILHQGLDQLTVDEILGVPEDAPYRFSLAEAVSPLRLRGMVGMLSRIKRQLALKTRA
jgi:cysteine desulfuration protein SufE